MSRNDEAARTLRKKRLSDDETRARMLETGQELVAGAGLTVSLEHLSFEEVIQRALVSRSAVYRLWPYKELYFSDLLLELAGSTNPSQAAYDKGTVELAVKIAIDNLEKLESPEGRRGLVVELCRQGSQQNFSALYGGTEWQTYVALTATLVSLPDGSLQTAMQQALNRSELGFIERMTSFYQVMLSLVGYRVQTQIPDGPRVLTTLGGAVVEGLALNSIVVPQVADTRFVADPFGVGEAREWTIPSVGYTSLVLGITEPDPEYTTDRLRGAEALLRQMLEVHAEG